jgi:hypothetical protein
MSNLRFMLVTVASFAAAFTGMSWASRGFPALPARVQPAQPESRPALAARSLSESVREALQTPRPAPGDKETGRHRMRLTAIEAANAYAGSPCDQAVKAAFVVATSTYISALSSKKDAAEFSTALDTRVQTAIQRAFEAGGVSREEFPFATQAWLENISGSQMNASPSCLFGRRAETLPR